MGEGGTACSACPRSRPPGRTIRRRIAGPRALPGIDPPAPQEESGGAVHHPRKASHDRPTPEHAMIQNLVDGILTGSIYSLAAIGLTLVMHMLRFANFSYAELLGIGAYSALVFDRLFSALVPALDAAIGPLTLSWALVAATLIAMAITGASAVLFDWLVFKRIRAKADFQSMVFASFGMALIVRNIITLAFGHRAELYSNDIAFAVVLSRDPMLLVRPDQVFTLGAAVVLMLGFHLVLTRTTFGFALRAVAENPNLAQVSGVRLSAMVTAVWMIGGALSAAAGIFYALTNHLSPIMGHNFVLPVFAATIVGGIGSVYGAVLGGFIVGIAGGLSLLILPSGYTPAMPFLLILGVLLLRPHGLFGEDRDQ